MLLMVAIWQAALTSTWTTPVLPMLVSVSVSALAAMEVPVLLPAWTMLPTLRAGPLCTCLVLVYTTLRTLAAKLSARTVLAAWTVLVWVCTIMLQTMTTMLPARTVLRSWTVLVWVWTMLRALTAMPLARTLLPALAVLPAWTVLLAWTAGRMEAMVRLPVVVFVMVLVVVAMRESMPMWTAAVVAMPVRASPVSVVPGTTKVRR